MSQTAELIAAGNLKALRPEDLAFAHESLARMAFIRAFEAKALALTQCDPPLVAGSIHLCAGQEAVPLGTLAALGDEDQILATYRGHGWALAAGLDPHAVMAEICHRAAGVNGGRGGSAYMMAPNTRFMGENSIVGAGTTIACGLALANRAAGTGRLVVVSIGDGAMNQGAVHEAMAFAAAFHLPVIFICENNGWSEMTATREMFRIERLAQRAKGYGIAAATLSGTDPIAVRDSVAPAAERCRAGEGPVLIECLVPRLWGHYNRDIEHYRSKEDKAQATVEDPLVLMAERLVAAKAMTREEATQTQERERQRVETLAEEVLVGAPPDPAKAHAQVVHLPAEKTGTFPEPVETREMSYIEAVNAALRAELETDPHTLVYGEDMGKAGGIFGATRYLQRDFGSDRVFDTPIAENAILGSAIGAALGGLKPIVEIMWADFIFVALDQLVNQAANLRYLTAGESSVPMVVRTQQGATPGSCPQHSQSIEALLAHVPGLKVALAATPNDAYGLLRAAAADPDPCVVIEARALYQTRGEVSISATPEQVGRARLHRAGGDAVIVTWGTMLPRALEAAQVLEQEGLQVGVLDLRWLSPLDERALVEAVKQGGGRVVVAHEAVRTGGFGAEIAQRLHELCPEDLRALRRVTTPDTRIPASPVLQAALLPGSADIAQALREICA
ncbi:MAG: thiamine pyrophosphate-dependent enzyme [Rhodovibrionaceae bacterium]